MLIIFRMILNLTPTCLLMLIQFIYLYLNLKVMLRNLLKQAKRINIQHVNQDGIKILLFSSTLNVK